MDHEETKLYLFYQLSKAVAFISDPKGLERHLTELLKKLISCNSILVFHNNRTADKFVASNPYNARQNETDSISFSHDDPLGEAMLVRRASQTRLSPPSPLLPLMQAELFIPLVSPDDVLGCLYAARMQANEFKAEDLRLFEHAASHLAFALERQNWQSRMRSLETANLSWQDKYISFLEALPFPAALVDVASDLLEEANGHLSTLLDITPDDFAARPFSQLCSISPTGPAGENLAALIDHLGARRDFRFTQHIIYDADKEKSLYVFLPPEEKPAPVAEAARWADYYRLNQALSRPVLSENPDDQILVAAKEIKRAIPYDYLALTLLDKHSGAGRPYILCTAAAGPLLDPECTWHAVENAEIGWVTQPTEMPFAFASAGNSGLPFTMPAHFSLLLMFDQVYVGNLALGRLQNIAFSAAEKSVLRDVAGHIARLLADKVIQET